MFQPQKVAREVYWRASKLWRTRGLRVSSRREDYVGTKAEYDDENLIVGGWQVMQEWERPLMRTLAEEVCRTKGHVLEIGFGMGISPTYVIELGCSKYTVIEAHPDVAEKARAWAADQPVPVEVVEGFWQDAIDRLGVFDGVLFDAFPTTKNAIDRLGVFDGVLFDAFPTTKKEFKKLVHPFIPQAAKHLRPDGVFTYFSGCDETLEADVLKLLLQNFREVRVYKETGLRPPPDCQYFTSSTMLVPVCTK